MPDFPDRHAIGVATLNAITGGSGEPMVESLKGIVPDVADWIVAFAYGDLMARPGLDKRTRQTATTAASTALGTATSQLKAHIGGARDAGCAPRRVTEAILRMAAYAGSAAAVNGVAAARQAFAARAPSPREGTE